MSDNPFVDSKQNFVRACKATADAFLGWPDSEKTAERRSSHQRLLEALKSDSIGESFDFRGNVLFPPCTLFLPSAETVNSLKEIATDTDRDLGEAIMISVQALTILEWNMTLFDLFQLLSEMAMTGSHLEEGGVSPGHLYQKMAIELRQFALRSQYKAQCIALSDFLEAHCGPPQ